MRKVVCFILIFVLVMTNMPFVPATASEDNLTIDEKLISMGVPTDIIAKMPELMKADMASHYGTGAFFGGSDETILNVPSDSNKSARDITSSQLKLWVTYVTLPSDSDGTAHRKVYANFEWLTSTATGTNDVFGVLWGNGWCLSDDYTPILTYQYRGSESNEIYTELYSISSSNSTSSPNQGLTYNKLSLRAMPKDKNESAVDHSGWLTLQLERSGGAMSTNVVASYSKAKVSVVTALSVDIESYSVSITPEISYHNELQSSSNYIMY